MKSEQEQENKDLYARMLDYCKYLYEEEKARTQRLNDAVKVYLTFFTLILGVVSLKLLPFKTLPNLPKNWSPTDIFEIVALFCFGTGLSMLLVSIVLTIIMLKIWHFERPCDPKQVAMKSLVMVSELDFMKSQIADFVVACDRDHEINNNKARLLSHALITVVASVIAFAVTLFLLTGLTLWKGAVQ